MDTATETELPSDRGYALAFETSDPVGSVALGCGGTVLESRTFSAPMRHAREFLSVVDGLCRTFNVGTAMVDTVHVSIGPGSFTGLRIGVAAARAMALARRTAGLDALKITAVSTLEVIAQNALRVTEPAGHAVVMLDAKRNKVYASLFALRTGVYEPLTEPAEVDPGAFLDTCPADVVVLGSGVRPCSQVINARGCESLPESLFAPQAETTFRLGTRMALQGKFVDGRDLVPLYVRAPEAEERWRQRNPDG